MIDRLDFGAYSLDRILLCRRSRAIRTLRNVYRRVAHHTNVDLATRADPRELASVGDIERRLATRHVEHR